MNKNLLNHSLGSSSVCVVEPEAPNLSTSSAVASWSPPPSLNLVWPCDLWIWAGLLWPKCDLRLLRHQSFPAWLFILFWKTQLFSHLLSSSLSSKAGTAALLLLNWRTLSVFRSPAALLIIWPGRSMYRLNNRGPNVRPWGLQDKTIRIRILN